MLLLFFSYALLPAPLIGKVWPPDFFDEICGQVFDQRFGEGTKHEYIVQFYPSSRVNSSKRKNQTSLKPTLFE